MVGCRNPGGKGRRVGPVFGVENKVHVQQPGGFLVGNFVKQHVEEVAGVVQVRVGRHRLQPLPQAVVGGHDGRPHSGQPDALADGGLRRVVVDLRVKGGQGGKARAQGVHGVAVLNQVQYLDYLVRDAPVGAERAVKVGQFLLRRQLPVKQQVNNFFKSGVFRQVVDAVAPVKELAHRTVNEAGFGGVQVNVLKSLHYLRGH